MEELALGLSATPDSLGDVLDRPEFRYFAVRTRYFDDRLAAALRSGIRQVVSLAAVMDSRPWRMQCPPGSRWYELDLPEMTAFKEQVIKEQVIGRAGIVPACARTGISTDLTSDWYGGLREAGFDQRQRSVWLAEGLLMYLPDEAAGRLAPRLRLAGQRPRRIRPEDRVRPGRTRHTRRMAGARRPERGPLTGPAAVSNQRVAPHRVARDPH